MSNWPLEQADPQQQHVMLRQHQIPSLQDILDVRLGLQVPAPAERWRVVLFVDFVRPMHAPWKWINEGFIGLGALLPFLRAAGAKQKRWAKLFYGDERNSAAK